MIDLKKEKSSLSLADESAFIEKMNKKNVDIPNHNDVKLKEKNAKKFLCILLSMIVVFIGIVCVFVNKQNKILLAQQKIDEAESASSNITNPKPETSANSGNNKTEKPETTAQAKPVVAKPKTKKPGTIDNPTIITIDKEKPYLTLVNVGYRISDKFEPNLVYVCNSEQRLDTEVAKAYEKMYAAAKKDGATLTPCSGYRSYERQETNYKRKIKFYEGQGFSQDEARKKAATRIMPPGSSEHNLGYAMDIICAEAWFKDTKEFKWLKENAQDYGFILRYPEDKQDITGVIYEPWHWRYVGVEAAKEMKENNQVLEEYLGVVK